MNEIELDTLCAVSEILPDRPVINQPYLHQSVEALLGAQRIGDPYTFVHQVRVSKVAERLCGDLGLGDFETEGIRVAGLLHDIGKIALSATILTKRGKLDAEEFELIKTHPRKGEEILNFFEFPWPVQEMVLQHHERLDGSGYPRGLSGPDLLLGAQVIAVADVAEAVLNSRPYRERLSVDDLYRILIKEGATLFNPGVVSSLVDLLDAGDEVLLGCLGKDEMVDTMETQRTHLSIRSGGPA